MSSLVYSASLIYLLIYKYLLIRWRRPVKPKAAYLIDALPALYIKPAKIEVQIWYFSNVRNVYSSSER